MDPNRCCRGARGDTLLRDEPPNPDAGERTPPPERFKHVYTDSYSFLSQNRAIEARPGEYSTELADRLIGGLRL